MSIETFNFTREKLTKAAFDLKLWCNHGGTNFTSKLFDLIAKADVGNKNKLRLGFPNEVFIFEEYIRSKDEKTFFNKWEAL